MRYTKVCRILGGVLVVLIGVAISFAGAQFWSKGPAAAPDIIANKLFVKRAAGALLIVAALLLVSGIAVLLRAWWGSLVAAAALVIFVATSFWVNYSLFGSIRPIHTGTNVIVSIIVLALLWLGSSREKRFGK